MRYYPSHLAVLGQWRIDCCYVYDLV
jgi:hypothetical protein